MTVIYERPNPPKDFGYYKTSDTSVALQWKADYTGMDGPKPWAKIRIGRLGGVGIETLQLLNWDALGATDGTLPQDGAFTYRIRSEGPGGVSDWVSTNLVVYTPPTTPANVTASRSGTSIRVAWTSSSAVATRWEVYHRSSGDWETSPIGEVEGFEWWHTAPSTSIPHTYRIMAVAPDGTRSLASAPSQTAAPVSAPNAPVDLGPVGTIPAGNGEAHLRSWKYSSADLSPQSAYQIQSRTSSNGGTTWTTWVTGAKVTATQPGAAVSALPAGTTVQWQVRVWGASATNSAWSAISTYKVADVPVAQVLNPSTGQPVGTETLELTTDTLTISWRYAGTSAQATYRATLHQGAWMDGMGGVAANPVETITGATATTTATFATRLQSNTPYSVAITVVDSDGLQSVPQGASVWATLPAPQIPTATATWSPHLGAVTIEATPGASGGGKPDAVSFEVQRAAGVGSGAWVSGRVPIGGQAIDPIPPMGQVRYSIGAFSASGAASWREVTVDVANLEDWVWVNGGPDFSVLARVRLNVATSSKFDSPSTRHSFVGRKRAVTYHGDERKFSVSVTGLTEEDDPAGNRSAWYRVRDQRGVVCYRDLLGRRIFGMLSDVSFDEETHDLSSLTFSVEEDDYVE